MIAIQLLIAYGDQVYAFFFKATKGADELKKKMESLLTPIKENRLELLGYIGVLEDSNSSEAARLEALNALGQAIPDAVDNNGQLKVSLDNLRIATEDYIDQLVIRAEIEATIELNSETFSRKRKMRDISEIEDAAERNKAIKEFMEEEVGYFDKIFGGESAIQSNIKDEIATDTRTIGEKQEEIKKNLEGGLALLKNGDKRRQQLQGESESETRKRNEKTREDNFNEIKQQSVREADEVIANLTKLQQKLKVLRSKADGGAGSRRTDPKVFEQKLLQLEKIEQRYREQAINKDGQTNEERTAQFEENELAKLDITIKNFIEREKVRLENHKKSVAKQNISDKEKAESIADAEAKFTNEVRIAAEDRLKVKEQIEAAGDLKLLRLLLEEQKIRRKFDLIKTESLKTSLGDDEAYFTARAAVFKANILAQEELVESFAGGTSERANADIELFNMQDELRKNDLAKEKAFIGNKKSINSEYVGFAQGISKLLGTIAGENEALQKASLVIEKGAAIADIVIKTQAANAVTVAEDTASLGLTLPVTTPLRIRNNVSAGISIANILATTITSFKKPSSGGVGGSGGGVVNAPAFNVVGTSSADQLAQTVAATSDRTPVINLSVNEIDDKINENTASVEYSGF